MWCWRLRWRDVRVRSGRSRRRSIRRSIRRTIRRGSTGSRRRRARRRRKSASGRCRKARQRSAPTRRCRSCFRSRRLPSRAGIFRRVGETVTVTPARGVVLEVGDGGPVKTLHRGRGSDRVWIRADVRDSDERWPAVRERLGRGAPVAEDSAIGADVSSGHALAGRRSLRRLRRAEDDAGCRCPRWIGRVPGRRVI